MAKTPKKKKAPTTFRGRLRATAETQLDALLSSVLGATERAVEESNAPLDPRDLLRILSSKEAKTLRNEQVKKLADHMESELEAIYNQQQGLPLGEPDAEAD